MLPTLYLSHGAPPLVDDELWVSQLAGWAHELPRPTAILVVSAHWESAPLTIGSTRTETRTDLRLLGVPDTLLRRTAYDTPGDMQLAARIESLMPDNERVAHDPDRRLDHGAYVPLTVMYPEFPTSPCCRSTMPTLDPRRLLLLGERLQPLRDEGVLIIGSGFTTHGLPFLDDPSPDATPPDWSTEFDVWVAEGFAAGDLDALIDFRHQAPGMPYAHPTIEHFSPLFVALGASSEPQQSPRQPIDGYWMGLAKRSIELA